MRTMDHRLLEQVANDPLVRPYVSSDTEEVRLEALITMPGNYAFTNDEGGFICVRIDEGLYEAHTMFRPGCDYKRVVELMRESFEFMFVETDCVEVVTKVAATNRPARHLALVGHFQQQFDRKDAWSPGVDLTYMNLPLDRWADVCSTRLQAVGATFHAQIEAAKQAMDAEQPLHPADPIHDQYVGLAVMMFRAGNSLKAVKTYNRWARFAGYQPIQLVWDQPVVIHTGDAVIQVRNGEMEVLLCQ